MSDPWSLIGSIIGGQATRNASATSSGRDASQRAVFSRQQPGMVMQSAPELDRSAQDATTPAEVVGNIGDMFAPGSKTMAKAYPLIGSAVQAEKDLYSPTAPAVGGYSVSPGSFSSNMQDYLNYMKYRR